MEIINKYKSSNDSDPLLLSKDALTVEQVYNRQLKEVAKQLNWTRKIYNKLARYTTSQLLIRQGVGVSTLSKILGHSKISTTEGYFDVNVREVFNGVENVNFGQWKYNL